MGLPNVLYITADQWRAECLSALGHPTLQTPNLDRLAARGVLFTNHWAVTSPCGPSRASMNTGMYLMNHRSVNNGTPLDARFTNVALEASSAGYETALFGYTDTTVDPRTVTDPRDPRLFTYESVLPGLSEVVRLTGDDKTAWAHWLQARGFDVPADPRTLYDPLPGHPGAADHGSSWAPARFPAELSEPAFLTESVIDWIDRRCGDRWFVHLSYLQPHPPYRAPQGYHDMYDPDSGPPFRRNPDREAELSAHYLLPLVAQLVGAPLDEREMRQIRATYWANMTLVDHQLGRLLDHLEATGLAAETFVLFTTDHGDQMGDHWMLEKLGWFDESYHVPLLIADPRPAADPSRGARVDAFTEAVDLMPTLLSAMGLEVPLQCDGRPLQPFVEGGGDPAGWRQEAHIQWDFREALAFLARERPGLTMEDCTLDVLRDRRFKYVHMAEGSSLLYDLDADPDQLHDRSTDPGCADVVSQMRARLLEWRMRYSDRTLTGQVVTPFGVVARPEPRRP